MIIKSSSFNNTGMIPPEFTCEGDNINPDISIESIPDNAKSMALLIEDIDAAKGSFIHWLVFNIPVSSAIDQNSIPGTQARNDSLGNNYYGPCPAVGTHRYVFTLYALDTMLDLPEGTGHEAVRNALSGRILAKAEITGKYKKKILAPV
ncbi:MAG: phosphatidylethanolamine-binding protein [Elusimicrobia bacterium RIFOXYA2_FULL_50_26]|nr:MAG: phosphatidylethanolamine-binding protein [Elusimicrobia bacterium RIFOXYA2_FULL_50_26]OGS23880.1 MAG: phosphatidylethanolamine-binding protein [Elusimicrobia bacterium RIFOXYB2_FULL_50_12]